MSVQRTVLETVNEISRLFNIPPPRVVFTDATETGYYEDGTIYLSTKLTPESAERIVVHEMAHHSHVYYDIPCVPSGEYILGGNKLIENYGVGERVLAFNGRTSVLSTIRGVSCRDYSGRLVVIKATGMLPLRLTPDHPVLVANFKRVERVKPHRFDYFLKGFTWKPASEVAAGDRLVFPKYPNCVGKLRYGPKWRPYYIHIKDYYEGRNYGLLREGAYKRWYLPVREEFAEFMGLYCAEGCAIHDGVIISLGKHEEKLVERTLDLVASFSKHEPHVFDKETAVCVKVSSKPLSLILKETVGGSALSKKIPDFILFGYKPVLRAFLRGYLKGDGHAVPNKEAIVFSTVSKLLALQLQNALARFNVFCSLQALNTPQEGLIEGRRVRMHQIYRGSVYSSKVKFWVTGKRPWKWLKGPRKRHILSDESAFYPKVERVWYEPYTGKVYNFETEHETFLVSNLVTHNCRTSECEAYANMFEEIWMRMKHGKGAQMYRCPACGYLLLPNSTKCLKCRMDYKLCGTHNMFKCIVCGNTIQASGEYAKCSYCGSMYKRRYGYPEAKLPAVILSAIIAPILTGAVTDTLPSPRKPREVNITLAKGLLASMLSSAIAGGIVALIV